MEFVEYINEKKEIRDNLLKFICDEDGSQYSYDDLINFFKSKENFKDKNELFEFLRLLVKISKNHHRTTEFNGKLEQIVQYFSKDIVQNFTNSEIFNIFKNNKLLVLYLLKNKILTMDKPLIIQMLEKDNSNSTIKAKYYQFFIKEIESFLKKEEIHDYDHLLHLDPEILENFEEKRQKDENESHICTLIRDDSIENFISHVREEKIQLSKTLIKPSIFETNPFLMDKSVTLIEYSAFYGSLKIFQYLLNKKVNISPLLYICVVHSDSQELLQNFELNYDESFKPLLLKCLVESIKCHHNKIAKNFIDCFDSDEINKKIVSYGFRYHNYEYFPSDINDKSIFYQACKNGYLDILQILFKLKIIDVNERIILKKNFFK